MCGVTVWGGGGQERRPKRIALPFRPACAVSGSSRGIQAAPRSAPAGRGGRGWEPGAWVQVGEGTASSRELGRGVRRGGLGQHCRVAWPHLSGAGPQSPHHRKKRCFCFFFFSSL